jgi:hypothetical protein
MRARARASWGLMSLVSQHFAGAVAACPGGGVPKGKANGRYRWGLQSAEAIADRWFEHELICEALQAGRPNDRHPAKNVYLAIFSHSAIAAFEDVSTIYALPFASVIIITQ